MLFLTKEGSNYKGSKKDTFLINYICQNCYLNIKDNHLTLLSSAYVNSPESYRVNHRRCHLWKALFCIFSERKLKIPFPNDSAGKSPNSVGPRTEIRRLLLCGSSEGNLIENLEFHVKRKFIAKQILWKKLQIIDFHVDFQVRAHGNRRKFAIFQKKKEMLLFGKVREANEDGGGGKGRRKWRRTTGKQIGWQEMQWKSSHGNAMATLL